MISPWDATKGAGGALLLWRSLIAPMTQLSCGTRDPSHATVPFLTRIL